MAGRFDPWRTVYRVRHPDCTTDQYATREEAIAAGLRGCKRCHSERFPDVLPPWLHKALAHMREHRSERLTENALIKITGADISTVRRYFKAHVGSTPLAFHRRIRLQYAHQLIASGANWLAAAFECGYQSASGFREAFQHQYGVTPGSPNVKR
jgi:AraC family transcriptional regulator of adaptative response/methylated-DNA-[protein]-cysteine methyltransferase